MRRPQHAWSFALLVALTAGCASPGMPHDEQGADVITTDEIRASPAANAYQLVLELHPEWLWKRGSQSISDPDDDVIVYYENARMGGPESLRRIPTLSVMTIRFFDARTAQYRWGSGHTHGAILVLANAQR